MSFSSGFAQGFYSGTVAISLDSRWDIGLAGHGYMLDWANDGEFRHETVPMIRQQSDTSTRPGEQSINPEGLWRRSVTSWHHGAGQSWLDRDDTDPFRYNTSKGVDPWNQYGLSLLPDTNLEQGLSGSNLYLATGDTGLYVTDGPRVLLSTGLGNGFNACSAAPGPNATGACSDGTTLYVGFGADGIYTTQDTTLASHTTGQVDGVWYTKGRLIAASGKALYNVVASGSAVTSAVELLDHDNADWAWTGVAPGKGAIFACGFAGDKSLLYRIPIKTDGGGLDVAVPCGELPDGEVARSLTGYLGFLVVGTDKGVRFAAVDDAGEATLGALIPTGLPVLCGEGQDRFVWYGLTNYDTASTGLGRLDLSVFTSSLTPAFASDLMATGQGPVTSVVTFGDRRVFAVAGRGVYAEQTAKVASGQVTSGRIGFGLPDDKTALYLTVRHDPLDADESVAISLATDNGTPVGVGVSDVDTATEPGQPFFLNQARGNDFEWTITINGDVTLRTVTLRADPTAERTETIFVPILLRTDATIDTVRQPVDVRTEKQYLKALRNSRRVVLYQEGDSSVRVIVDDLQFRPFGKTPSGDTYQGTAVLTLKEV